MTACGSSSNSRARPSAASATSSENRSGNTDAVPDNTPSSDRSALCRAKRRCKPTYQVKWPEEVGLEYFPERGFIRRVEHTPHQTLSGVAHEQVDVLALVDRVIHLGWHRDIEPHRYDAVTVAFATCDERVRVPGAGVDPLGSTVEYGVHECRPDAAVRTGDQYRLASIDNSRAPRLMTFSTTAAPGRSTRPTRGCPRSTRPAMLTG